MESEAFFQEKVYLTPKDLRNEITSVDTILISKLKERLEQRCSPHGYVLPGTLELLTRSAGMVDSGRFSGDWAFLVKAKGSVLHPPENTVVEVEVLKNNKMGVYAVYENAIRIMVPRDIHIGNEDFDSLKVGERIQVKIKKSRFQLRDPFIVSVAEYLGRASSDTKVEQILPEKGEDAAEDLPEDEGATERKEVEESGAEEEEEEEAKEE